ncbi:MAG TPA: YciI family protein [Pseudonocardia sp.]|jgi:hypothetical protein
MTRYLLSVVQPSVGEPPSADQLARIVADLETFHQDLRAAGAWVFAGGLHGPDSATMVRTEGDDVLITDGPFAEGKEFLGGLCIVEAPDLDAALEWASRAARATTLPIEVRPFHDER